LTNSTVLIPKAPLPRLSVPKTPFSDVAQPPEVWLLASRYRQPHARICHRWVRWLAQRGKIAFLHIVSYRIYLNSGDRLCSGRWFVSFPIYTRGTEFTSHLCQVV